MERTGPGNRPLSARAQGLAACPRCAKVWPIETVTCGRCGAHVESRDPHALQKVWAWWIAGVMCYVPANLYPMLSTRTLLSIDESTIIGGAVDLAHHGAYGIALVILVASVAIPMVKFFAIAFLALTVQRVTRTSQHQRLGLFELVEYIGRWSMIDVFVVAILSSLVQLNTLASINPGPASLFFALSVIFTMLSAQSFDPRLIWDGVSPPKETVVQ